MKIGLSYSRCVLDIVEDRVDIDDVLVLITRTDFDPRDDGQWAAIWEGYCYGGMSRAEWGHYDFTNKDDEDKTNLTKAIKQVANKNIKQISEWQKINPKYNDPESKQNDKYMQIVLNSMSGSTNEEATKNYEKIIKNVIKETIIDKCN